jgi:hypothetical protein
MDTVGQGVTQRTPLERPRQAMEGVIDVSTTQRGAHDPPVAAVAGLGTHGPEPAR